MSFKLSGVSVALCLVLTACGNDDSAETIVPEPVSSAEPSTPPTPGTSIMLDTVIENITSTEPQSFYVDVTEEAPTLVVSLFNGTGGEDIGDPALYLVKGDSEASSGAEGNFDCVSYNGGGQNEVCMLDDVEPGRYYILVDASEASPANDASLYVTTGLFEQSQQCDEVPVRLRGQSLSSEQMMEACDLLAGAKYKFDAVMDSVAPEFGTPIEGDLNEFTEVNVFSSNTHHAAWVEHLFNSGNTSGIYFETEPSQWFHNSVVNTFNQLEWSGGRDSIRSLQHEYIHALDGRFNKKGGYVGLKSVLWWAEGLAEYTSHHYGNPHQILKAVNQEKKYTLQEIFDGAYAAGEEYTWGMAAVAFLIEKRPELVTQILSIMREGGWVSEDVDGVPTLTWAELDALLEQIAKDNQADFVTWYTGQLKSNYASSATSIAFGEYVAHTGRSGRLYSVNVPEGTDSITVKTSGGSGFVDLWVNEGAAHHPSYPDNTSVHSSTSARSNDDEVTIETPAAGNYYITVADTFGGTDFIDVYLSVCEGKDCNVNLPDQKETKTVVAPYLPHWPEKGMLGTCTLVETYSTDAVTNAPGIDFSIKNNSDNTVTVHWVSR